MANDEDRTPTHGYVVLGCLTFILQIWWRSQTCGNENECLLSFGKGALTPDDRHCHQNGPLAYSVHRDPRRLPDLCLGIVSGRLAAQVSRLLLC